MLVANTHKKEDGRWIWFIAEQADLFITHEKIDVCRSSRDFDTGEDAKEDINKFMLRVNGKTIDFRDKV